MNRMLLVLGLLTALLFAGCQTKPDLTLPVAEMEGVTTL